MHRFRSSPYEHTLCRGSLKLHESWCRIAAFCVAWARSIAEKDEDQCEGFHSAAKQVRYRLIAASSQVLPRFWASYQAGEDAERTALEQGNSLCFRLGEKYVEPET